MRYVSSKLDQKMDDDIYRFYISNGIKILTSNTAKFAGGSELTKTFRDIVRPPMQETEQDKQEQEQEAQSVINQMIARMKDIRG